MKLSEQDEEFLDAINELSENKKNIVINYMKDKCEANKKQSGESEKDFPDITERVMK